MTTYKIVRPSQEEIQRMINRDLGLSIEVTDEMAIPTYRHSNPLVRWLFWKRYEEIAVLARLEPHMRVLEFGCGMGFFLPTLCANAGDVSAIDLFPQYAQAFVSERGLKVHFPENLGSVMDGSLDLIIAADVLEHIDDISGILAACRSKLRDQGRLIISGPTENILYKIGRVVAGFSGKGDYHVSNINIIRQVICRNGFVLRGTRKLPFVVPPHLFKVHEFETSP